jgi:bacillithiol biosynthesis deacetylase BshB1
MVRKYQPEIALINTPSDRHPDHGKASKLVSDSLFLAGLRKIETEMDDQSQQHWRPKSVYHYIQDHYHEPDFVVDITETWETKMDAIKAFSSQFYDPNSSEPETPISGKEFFNFLESRARQFARPIRTEFAEGFTTERAPGVKDLFDLL